MTPTRAPVTVGSASDLLSAALHAWPAGCDNTTDRLIGGALWSLDDAITHAEELAEGVHWSSVYPGLDSPEPEYEAAQIAAQDLTDAAKGVRDVYAQLGITLQHQPKKAAA